ncbi:MAG: hypothetical protein IKF68_06770 [Erysipelotrichaceae bacterium]|nr:hypothetical protein [Erysipelotrichaceae bacterium]
MDKKKKLILGLFILVTCGFLFSAYSATRAVLIRAANYRSQFQMYDIGVTLNENGTPLAWRSYDADTGDWHVNADAELLGAIDKIQYAKTYEEELSVTNSGQIDEYVRVIVYRYWVDAEGNKVTELEPDMIKLNFTESENWILDETYSTDERTVLYYALPLKGSESGTSETSENFLDSFVLDGDIKTYVIQTETEEDADGYTVVTNTYKYDGTVFCLDVEVDAIQTHNAEDAAMSAWGRQIKLEDETTGRISLVKEGE